MMDQTFLGLKKEEKMKKLDKNCQLKLLFKEDDNRR